MKRMIVWLAGLCMVSPLSAQDIILLRDASEIEASVTEIDDESVVYRRFGDPDGPLRRVARSDVFAITYANGEREAFAEERPRYPWPPVSRSYAVGELFDEGGVRGIVIHTTDGGRHGVLLSLDMANLAFVSSRDRDIAEIPISLADAQDGWRNRLVLERFVRESGLSWSLFPACDWCRSLGPGWYLPAVDELKYLSCFTEDGRWPQTLTGLYVLMQNMAVACKEFGAKNYSWGYLWSSTESESKVGNVWHIRPDCERKAPGRFEMCAWPKTNRLRVKAFHRF